MASLKALKIRIGSVKSTQKITKAMKMVAAAKLRRAQSNAESGRPYSRRLSDVVARTGAFMEAVRQCHGNVLVSTHAIAMKGILEYLTPDSNGGYWSKHIGNCAVYTVECGEDGYTIPIEL